jgi:hypothetical protein
MMDRRDELLMGWIFLILWLIIVVLWCLLPPRYSDGRLAEDIAREMYDAGRDEVLYGGGR